MRTSNICGVLTLLLASLYFSALPIVGAASLARRSDPSQAANATLPLPKRDPDDDLLAQYMDEYHDALHRVRIARAEFEQVCAKSARRSRTPEEELEVETARREHGAALAAVESIAEDLEHQQSVVDRKRSRKRAVSQVKRSDLANTTAPLIKRGSDEQLLDQYIDEYHDALGLAQAAKEQLDELRKIEDPTEEDEEALNAAEAEYERLAARVEVAYADLVHQEKVVERNNNKKRAVSQVKRSDPANITVPLNKRMTDEERLAQLKYQYRDATRLSTSAWRYVDWLERQPNRTDEQNAELREAWKQWRALAENAREVLKELEHMQSVVNRNRSKKRAVSHVKRSDLANTTTPLGKRLTDQEQLDQLEAERSDAKAGAMNALREVEELQAIRNRTDEENEELALARKQWANLVDTVRETSEEINYLKKVMSGDRSKKRAVLQGKRSDPANTTLPLDKRGKDNEELASLRDELFDCDNQLPAVAEEMHALQTLSNRTRQENQALSRSQEEFRSLMAHRREVKAEIKYHEEAKTKHGGSPRIKRSDVSPSANATLTLDKRDTVKEKLAQLWAEHDDIVAQQSSVLREIGALEQKRKRTPAEEEELSSLWQTYNSLTRQSEEVLNEIAYLNRVPT